MTGNLYKLVIKKFTEKHGGYWDGEHPRSSLEDWRREVANGDTRLGYWDWAWQREEMGETENAEHQLP